MNRLLLIDGSNLMMRAAFGGDITPAQAVPIATGLVERVIRQMQATHLVLALDTIAPSWRKELYPAYKANRTQDTGPWLAAACDAWEARGWYVAAQDGFEADDILATIARRAARHYPVAVVSSDSDLLVLAATEVVIVKPQNGGKFETVSASEVCGKYRIVTPALLTDLKALTGESGDNIKGVPGIGPVRAAELLATYHTLEQTIAAGRDGKCKHSATVAAHEPAARLAHQLVSLRYDVPLPPIQPALCALL